MAWLVGIALVVALVGIVGLKCVVEPLYLSPLARIPGPKAFALTKWKLRFEELKGTRTAEIHRFHQKYGPVVRIGPKEVHFNSPTALRTIYGAGSGFEKSDFYRMFVVFGKDNVFTFVPVQGHAERKKLLAHAYSKTNIVRGIEALDIESKVEEYLKVIESTLEQGNDIFDSLHWYSLDNITNFLYGPEYGGTSALRGDPDHQRMLEDIVNPKRRVQTWCVMHFPAITGWLYAQTGIMERIVQPFLPMQKPQTYTRIRAHALKSMQDFKAAEATKELSHATRNSVIARLWASHESRKTGGLGDFDVASECSDHFLAGIDTTSDTIMFLIWALSLPKNRKYQERLIEESRNIPAEWLNEDGNPKVETLDKLPYFDAVLKEALRIYTPLPESEPRKPPQDIQIDGYLIPAGTVVSCAPYSLHRNPKVFPDPIKFDPDRWLREGEDIAAMKRWWWAFSSGGRMCIGMHLAMAEMVVVPALYRRYSSTIKPEFEDITPGITSRFEVFSDETFARMEEHTCKIQFHRLN